MLLDYAYHRRWHALIVCPAALRPMWQTRLHQTKIQATILGQELLGREDFDPEPYGKYDVILVDESHNFRNRDSGRYENLSRLIGFNGGRGEHGYRKKLILMTATPINNSVMDLHNQIRFFTARRQRVLRRCGDRPAGQVLPRGTSQAAGRRRHGGPGDLQPVGRGGHPPHAAVHQEGVSGSDGRWQEGPLSAIAGCER